jgi:hypothetical protein
MRPLFFCGFGYSLNRKLGNCNKQGESTVSINSILGLFRRFWYSKVLNFLKPKLKAPSNYTQEVLFELINRKSVRSIDFNWISDVSILFGSQDGQQAKQTLVCISKFLNGTEQK